MNFFTFDVRKVFLWVVVIVLPLLAVNMQRKSEEELWFTKPFTWSAGLIQKGYSSFSSGVRGTTALYLDLINIKVQNRDLQRENAEMRAQLGSMTELKMENERLSQLLGFKQAANLELLAARVIGLDLLPDHSKISIDRGTNHGIRKNMASITTGGVVGYVYRAEPTTSQILLLTDRYAVINAIVQRSRARGLVEGYGKDQARLKYLKRSDDVQVGDLIVTSGLDGLFPKGFPVGTVLSIDKSRYGMTQEVELKPVVDPTSLEEVFIVLNSQPEQIKETGNVKNHWLTALNVIVVVIFVDLMCAFQTSLWMQVLGMIPPPMIWVPVLTYIILHRPIWESVGMMYILTFVLCAYTAEPFEHFLLANMLTLVFVLVVKNRIYWSGTNYFMMMTATTTLLHFFLIFTLSQIFDRNPLRNPEIFHWMISFLMTVLISIPLYGLMKWFDKMTEREESGDSIGSLV